MLQRILSTTILSTTALFAVAQDAAQAPKEPFFQVDNNLLYAMLALAVVQVIFIVSLAGIMRTMGGTGGWVKRLVEKGGRGASAVALLLLAGEASAQAYKGGDTSMSPTTTFWLLFGINLFLFIILLVQMNILRALTRAVVGATDDERKAPATGPSWADRLLKKMTRQAAIEEEKDIVLHHDYDGIRELDNVLPPWWLWLFYGTILWGVVYLVNVHVIRIWPDSVGEYKAEMVQAQADVDAYLATLTSTVDENTVTFTDNAGTLATGRELFNTFCVACHGADGSGSESSVGPNLTDAYWLHGGGIKNIFKTIKYGVPEKGMIAWKAQLQPAEISAIASYIVTLEGKGGATQKAPQGELWKEEGSAPADSNTTAPVDTVRVAMR
ncbi:MAG: c-type cytochrome [Flavobacteriales bacterium]|nr:c-type cytochrome [Flavobacteriales bacterium]